MRADFDYILAGGGLQSALLVLALRARRPASRLALVERGARLGGNHTWCFHAGDLAPSARAWVHALVCRQWPGYSVRFPGFERRIDREYAMITSSRLHQVVSDAFADSPVSRLYLGSEVRHLGAREVELVDGSRLTATVVIDARGAEPPSAASPQGYQKFLGIEIELAHPHAFEQPMLMDATVEQVDGFRFVYTLPLAPRRLLVEDTTFSNAPALDRELLRRRIHDYVRGQGLEIARIEREEEGILPMPWRARHELPRCSPLLAGMRGGFFHPGTGYSFPIAARLADLLSSLPPESLFGTALQDFARAHWRQARFCHLLNRMLFGWFAPRERWHVLRRFYRLPVDTIERYYALQLRHSDRARLICGRPPSGLSWRHRLVESGSR